jgi:hypothetical protein
VRRAAPSRLAALAALLLLAPATIRAADPRPATEIEVKAAFLYHFAQLVTWPKETQGPVVVAVVGRDPFGDRLEATIGDQAVRGRPIRIERASRPRDLASVPHVLFVGAATLPQAQALLAEVPEAPVLTVGAAPGFAGGGGMVEFRVTPDARVAFDIDLRAVDRAGLAMSSQLLKIARIVSQGQGQGQDKGQGPVP